MYTRKQLLSMSAMELKSISRQTISQTKMKQQTMDQLIINSNSEIRGLKLNEIDNKIDFNDPKTSFVNLILAHQERQEKLDQMIAAVQEGNYDLQSMIESGIYSDATNKGARDGLAAHDKYARVMEMLSNQAADLRETWDSDDVLEIDDIAIEEGISYEEAKELVDKGEVETEDI